ncbi:PGBD5 [Cordylochernes scorpioides]|uniref:PGBD5 n=1 Tax=Cordylochernes scorpioides TaxID=51811 RepID=A0ABY6KS74_9ARAC|nr:PGBD5 [Cordylochernes scorpioides]
MSIDMPNSASPRSPGSAGQKPGRPSIPSPIGGKNSTKEESLKEISRDNSENQEYANPPTGVGNANLAVARGDITSGLPPATSANGATCALRNWADCPEDQGPGADDDFTVVRTKKRRRESANSPTAAAPSSNIGGARTSRRPQSLAGSVPRAQEVRTTRAHITEARARQTSSSEDHCVYLEHGPELQPFHYLRALDRMLGGTAGVIQVSKVNGHQLLGLANRGLAERLINEGLEVEGALLRAFPFRKRAERITVGNLPFFVEDSAIISALKPYGRVTSIAPKLMKAGPYTYNDGRREAFIVLREGMTIERLPTRLEIPIKGEAWPAYLSSGIKCSRCHGQGHRRANCPLLAGRANNSRLAPPTSPAGVPSTTTSAPPQRSAAQPPAPAPSSTAMEIPGASHAARAVTPSAAPRPSTPVASAVPMEMAPPAPPPVTPAPSLRAPGSHEPAAPTPDIEMSIVEETSTSSTSSLKTSTREGLVTFIERNPGISFAQTDALGLGREEVLDILSSKTKARKRGPLLSPSQCGALAGLIRQLLGQRPGGDSNIYKVLRQVLSELRTAPTAVPSTPPLPAPRPSGPTPPTSHSEELMPAVMTPPPPAPTEMEEDNPMTEKERCAPPPPAPRLAEPTPPTPHGEELTPAMATPPPPLPFLIQVELETKCVDRIFDLFKEQNYQQALGPLLKKGLDIDNLSHSIVWLKTGAAVTSLDVFNRSKNGSDYVIGITFVKNGDQYFNIYTSDQSQGLWYLVSTSLPCVWATEQGRPVVKRTCSIQHDSIISKVCLFQDTVTSKPDDPIHLVVTSTLEVSVVYRDVLNHQFQQQYILPNSNKYDCTTTALVANSGMDENNRILLTTYGHELLIYRWTGVDYHLELQYSFGHPLLNVSHLDFTGDGICELVVLSTHGVHVLQMTRLKSGNQRLLFFLMICFEMTSDVIERFDFSIESQIPDQTDVSKAISELSPQKKDVEEVSKKPQADLSLLQSCKLSPQPDLSVLQSCELSPQKKDVEEVSKKPQDIHMVKAMIIMDSGSEIDDEVKDPDYENSASDELEFEEEEREEIPAKRPRLEVAPVRMLTTCRDTSTAAAGSNVAAGTWRKDDPSPPTPPPFTARPGLNLVGDVSSPFDAFSLFFTENIFKSIKEETNRYARSIIDRESKKGPLKPHGMLAKWKAVSVAQIKLFFCVIIHMSLVKKPGMKDYWSTHGFLKNAFCQSINMPRTLFMRILSMLHLNDNSKYIEYGKPGHDRLFKIRPVLESLIYSFGNAYTPQQNLTIDEAMCPFRGRVGFRVYIKGKPHKYGIKIFQICEAVSGYAYNLDIYTGKDPEQPEHNSIPNLVDRLAKRFYGQGYHIYFDRWFSSPELFDKLWEKKTLAVGTVMPSRKTMPKTEFSQKLKRGEIIKMRRKHLLAIKWKDVRDVFMLSTVHEGKMMPVKPKTPTREELFKPDAVIDYNKGKVGVDRSNQMMAYYSFSRKTLKWWKKIFFHLFSLCFVNGNIIYNKANPDKKISLKDFYLAVGGELLNQASIEHSEKETTSKTDVARLLGKHYCYKIAPESGKAVQRRCKVCADSAKHKTGKAARKDTRFECKQCKIPLCVGECFEKYHAEMKYWE